MEKLISMTDFVLQENKVGQQVNSITSYLYQELSRIKNYANFLKKPLKLGYFIPCDKNDEALPRPSLYDPRSKTGLYDIDEYDERVKEYQEAKQRVLFEFQSDFKSWSIGDIKDSNIEELLSDDREYILTDVAKKEIGLRINE